MNLRFLLPTVEIAFAAGAIAVAIVSAPHAVLTAIGLPMLFLVPGLALVDAVLPDMRPHEERVMAAVGFSVVIATGAAVLLAATPLGLTRSTYAATLGGITIALSVYGINRQHPHPDRNPVDA